MSTQQGVRRGDLRVTAVRAAGGALEALQKLVGGLGEDLRRRA